MFNIIRKHQRLMQLVLLVLILPSFVLIGVSGYTNYNSGDEDLVEIGKQAVTAQEFDAARRNQLNEMQRNMGDEFDPEIAETTQVKQQLLDSLIDRRMLIEVATKERFSVSDASLRQAIAMMPELQEEGTFSAERYKQLLANAGLSTRDFEQSQRAEQTLNRVIAPVVETAVLPQTISNELENILTESRTVQLHSFTADQFIDEQVVTDKEIEMWYEANQQQLQLPDYVNIDFLLLNEEAAINSVSEVSDDDLHAYYEQNKSRFLKPAKAHLSHILIESGSSDNEQQDAKARAKELAAQVKDEPTRFAEIAKEHSEDKGSASTGGELGWITQGNWPEALENAVFSLKKGEVSGVIDGPDGYHIFKANDHQAEQSQTFESVRDTIVDEVREQLAAEQFADMATTLTDQVYDSPENLDAAAAALGLSVQQAQGMARDRLLSASDLGVDAQPEVVQELLDDPRVRRALYTSESLENQHNAGVVELSSDSLVAVRINEFVPAHTPELDQLYEQVEKQLRYEKALAAARKAGHEQLARLHDNPEAATEESIHFDESIEVSRIDNQQLSKDSLEALMQADVESLPTYTGVESEQGFQLIKVVAANSGSPDPLISDSLQAQLQQLWGEAQQHAYMQALRKQLDVKELPAMSKAMDAEVESVE